MSRKIFRVSAARFASVVGSFFFIAYDVATRATPGTAVIGSGAAMSATPTFLIVLATEFGFVRVWNCRVIVVGSTREETSDLASASLVSDSVVERSNFFSCKPPIVLRRITLMTLVKSGCVLTKLYTNPASIGAMPKLLEEAEVRKRLRGLKGWKLDGKFIVKTFEFEEFMDGIKFIEDVAKVAESEEHHPDIHVRYTTVTLSVQTHSEEGVTEWDVDLAEAIEKMLARKTGTRTKPR
jgi:4a-hydroxytetrahydrobiopterin dehydratase